MKYTDYFAKVNKEHLGFPKLTVHMFAWMMNIVCIENRIDEIRKMRMVAKDHQTQNLLHGEEILLQQKMRKLTNEKSPEHIVADLIKGAISG